MELRFTNTYTVRKGTFGVAKKAHGENGNAAEHEFVFDYTCGAETGQVRARGNGLVIEAPVELPVGTECTVTERKEAVDINGYEFLTPDDQLTKTVMVRDDETSVAEFVNTYKRQTNKFKVEKTVKVIGDAVAPDTFDFDYTCVLGEDTITGEILDVPANGSGESADIPTNYVCTVTERDAKVAGTTLVTEIGDSVTIPANASDATPLPVIKVDNIYTTVGEFTITKKLVDPDGIAAGKTFDFKYVCTPPADRAGEAPIEGVLTVAAGASATSPTIPTGYNCEIKEVGAEIVDSNLVTTGLDTTLVVAHGETTMEVTNTYSQWKGTLEVSKGVLGIKPDSKLLKDHEFEAAFKCVKNDKTTNEGSIKVKAGETVTVDNIVANSVCTVTEKLDSTKVSSLRFQPELSTTKTTAEKITVDGGSTKAKLLNSYMELGHFAITKKLGGLTGEAAGKDHEFHMIAIWTDNGVETTKEFTIRAGQVYKEFPALPVGTKVTLKERKPADGVFIQWHTPGFTSDRAGAIVDHHDGTAELTIVTDSPADKPQLVTLTNTGNPPWWWALVPLAILSNNGSSTTTGTNPTTPHSTTPQAPAQAKSSNAPASLAHTGASVLGVVALAGLAVAAGVFLVRRGRNNS